MQVRQIRNSLGSRTLCSGENGETLGAGIRMPCILITSSTNRQESETLHSGGMASAIIALRGMLRTWNRLIPMEGLLYPSTTICTTMGSTFELLKPHGTFTLFSDRT